MPIAVDLLSMSFNISVGMRKDITSFSNYAPPLLIIVVDFGMIIYIHNMNTN